MTQRGSGSSSWVRVALPAVLGFAYYAFARPRMLRTGLQPGEAQRTFPGDDLIAAPNFEATRATLIKAAPEAVWPWIAQMGREQTGYYGLDQLTNGGIPSAAYLRQDLPAPQTGMALDGGYRLIDVEPHHLLLYGSFDQSTPLGNVIERSVLVMLEPQPGGNTRLIIRERGYTYGMLGPLYNLIYEVIDYLQGMMQLDNIRQRAETAVSLFGRGRAG